MSGGDEMVTKKRSPVLDAALAKVRKDFDLEIGSLKEIVPSVEGISTGNVGLDWVTGVNGIPKGRIAEFYGLQSSGKTTAALQVARTVQRQTGKAVGFFDYEQALDPAYCEALGVNVDELITSQPDTFEDGIEAIRLLVKTGEMGLIIVDSVAQMTIRKELEEDIDSESSTFKKAKMMAKTMRTLTPVLAEHGTPVIFLNHVRDVIDTGPSRGFGPKRKTTPGGGALKFAASLRMYFDPIKKLTRKRAHPLTGEEVYESYGSTVKLVCEKNKVGVPYRTSTFRLYYGQGFSPGYTVATILIARKLIKKDGSNFSFTEDTTWGYDKINGEDNLVTAIEADPEWLEHLSVLARRILDEEGLPPVIEVEEVPEIAPELELERVPQK
jgi:recombination protein RecA